MKVQLIHNPVSGSHHASRLDLLKQAFAACGATVTVGETRLDSQRTISNDCDLLCVSGGDGTLGLVIAEIARNALNIPICVFPAGTVNLVARELGYSADPELFAREVMTGFVAGSESRLRDPVVQTEHAPVVACLSAGPDGVAVATHSPSWKKRIGKSAYALSFLKLFTRWPRNRFMLKATDKQGASVTFPGEAFYIAKGRYFAGPWTLSPSAFLGQEHFHLIALTNAGRFSFFRFMLRVAMGRDPSRLPFVQSMAARAVQVETNGSLQSVLAFQIDGDPMPEAPAEISVTEQYIEYCLPRPG
ncbi:diacylglycerol kinase family protein [Parasphingorhabdus sp.]|uniref:diacylglycerol/lipid kinase family protein n=1 Tax=Parasphingorhabdus sp. TaxID=2709688 RepID=UPI00326314CE